MTIKKSQKKKFATEKQVSRSSKMAKWLMIFLAVTMLFSTFAGYVINS